MRALAVLVAAAAFPRAAALVVYYNVFSKNVATAVEIVWASGKRCMERSPPSLSLIHI